LPIPPTAEIAARREACTKVVTEVFERAIRPVAEEIARIAQDGRREKDRLEAGIVILKVTTGLLKEGKGPQVNVQVPIQVINHIPMPEMTMKQIDMAREALPQAPDHGAAERLRQTILLEELPESPRPRLAIEAASASAVDAGGLRTTLKGSLDPEIVS